GGLAEGDKFKYSGIGSMTEWGGDTAHDVQQRIAAKYEELSDEEKAKNSFMGIHPRFNTEMYKKAQIKQEQFNEKLDAKRQLGKKDTKAYKGYTIAELSSQRKEFKGIDYSAVLSRGNSKEISSTFGSVAAKVVQAKKDLDFINQNIDTLNFTDKQKTEYEGSYKTQNDVLTKYMNELKGGTAPSQVKYKDDKTRETVTKSLAVALKNNSSGVFDHYQRQILQDKESKLTGLKQPFNVFEEDPRKYIELKEAIKNKDGAKVNELTEFFKTKNKAVVRVKALKGKDHVSELIMGGDTSTSAESALTKLLHKITGSLESSNKTTSKKSSADALDLLTAAGMKKYNQNNSSLPVYHNGGMVAKTGPLFAERGELLLPKKFADGGQVVDGLKIQDMTSQKVVLDANDFLTKLESITLGVDDTPIKVATDIPIPVDLTNPIKVEDKILKVEQTEVSVAQPTWKIPVEEVTTTMKIEVDKPAWKIDVDVPTDVIRVEVNMPTEKIQVDVSEASAKLSATIAQAISSNKIRIEETSGGNSVGADKIDTVAKAISDVNDKLMTSVAALKTDFDSEIQVLNSKPVTVDMDSIQGRIKEELIKELNTYKTEMNESKSAVDDLRSKMVSSEQLSNYRSDEVDRRLNGILNRIGGV
nr:hypothetical protein [Sulfurovaceae bacterium]